MPNNKNHQQQAQDTSDQSHQDAKGALKVAKATNPFSLTNIILATTLVFGSWMANNIWSSMQEGQKDVQAAVGKVWDKVNDIHDTVIVHGTVLSGIQNDVGGLKLDVNSLKANCMTEQKVDDRIHLIVPQYQQRHGGTLMNSTTQPQWTTNFN